MDRINKIYFLPVVSGLLAAISQPPFNLEFFVWTAFIPLLFFVFQYKKNLKNVFLIGTLAGLVYFLISYNWFWAVYPLDKLGVESKFMALGLISSAWMFSSFASALFWGLFLAAAVIFIRKTNKKAWWLIIPSLFVLQQYILAWAFGYLTFGSGTLFGPHGTFHNIAYATHNNPLTLVLASTLGIYGVSFFVLLVNSAAYILISKRKRNFYLLILILVLSIWSARYWMPLENQEPEEGTVVIVIQTKIAPDIHRKGEEKADILRDHLNLLNQTKELKERPDIIVFPENTNLTTNLSSFSTPELTKSYFSNLFGESSVIIDHSRIQNKSKSIFIDSKEGLIGSYDKRFLTPFGEFLPYFFDKALGLFPGLKNPLVEKSFYSNGITPSLPNKNMSAFICADLFSPELIAEVSSLEAGAIIIQSSTGIFKGNRSIVEQVEAVAKFRAAENNKFIVLASNFGRSYVINNKGKTIKKTGSLEPQLFTTKIKEIKDNTWYNKLGDIIIIITAAILILAALIAWERNKNS